MKKKTRTTRRKVVKRGDRDDQIRARFNYEQTLKTQLQNPVNRPDGPGIAMAQSIENSADAGATEIVIFKEKFNGEDGIWIADNGTGMRQADLDSMTSFADTSKKGEEARQMAGIIGTGSKLWLGVAPEIEDGILHYTSVADDFEGTTETEINFRYLVKLAKAGELGLTGSGIPVARKSGTPRNWSRYFDKRETGTTLVVTGVGRAWTISEIITQLSGHLVPRVAKTVKVLRSKKQNLWSKLDPPEFLGEPFSFSETMPTLGIVELDVYLGLTADNLWVCGRNNLLHTYWDTLKRFGLEQKRMLPNVFRGVGGYISIEHARNWKEHDGSFKREFYSGQAGTEFIEFLQLVAPDVEAKVKEARRSKQAEQTRTVIRKLRETNQKLFKVPNIDDDKTTEEDEEFGGNQRDSRGIFVTPTRMEVSSEIWVTLRDQNGEIVRPDQTFWIIDDENLVEIIGEKSGTRIKLRSGDVAGKTRLTLLNQSFPGGELVAELSVFQPRARVTYIKGPSAVKPGTRTPFRLVNLGNIDPSKISWSIQWPIKRRGSKKTQKMNLSGVKLNDKNKDTVVLETQPDCDTGFFYIQAKPSRLSDIAYRKRVEVKNPRKKLGVWQIGKERYVVDVGGTFPHALACVVDPVAEPRVIEVNGGHPILEDPRGQFKTLLMEISFAALASQLDRNVISSYTTLMAMHAAFVHEMSTARISKKED